MIKYLFIGLFIAWLFFASPWSRPRPGQKPSGKAPSPQPVPPQQMVACAHCGVHLPVNEALIGPPPNGDAPLYFCGEDHRRAGPRSR